MLSEAKHLSYLQAEIFRLFQSLVQSVRISPTLAKRLLFCDNISQRKKQTLANCKLATLKREVF